MVDIVALAMIVVVVGLIIMGPDLIPKFVKSIKQAKKELKDEPAAGQ
jgi:Sec-independent protein translocase protein TatA